MGFRCGASVYVERYAEFLERVFYYLVVAVHYVLRGHSLFAGLDGYGHSVLVAAADKEHLVAAQTQVACVNVGGHIYSGQMADMHRTVGIG